MNFTDQLNRSVVLPHWPPRRIVSLVPSQTEFLADLGLGEEVVGITKFCVRPVEWFAAKPRVGGTKTLDFQKISALAPDLILGNKEENERAQIELLAAEYPVWLSDVATLEGAFDMMQRLGALVGKAEAANEMVSEIRADFAALRPIQGPAPRVAYLIWRKPYMVAGGGTFIDAMLCAAGLVNVFADQTRYPEVGFEVLAAARPDALLLSSEPYPFAEKHLAELRAVCPNAQIRLVDGEIFSWYGSRLRHAPAYLMERLELKIENGELRT
jgi:ABC-type Fe3+-hydroxamate transport system substrate-binding protein